MFLKKNFIAIFFVTVLFSHFRTDAMVGRSAFRVLSRITKTLVFPNAGCCIEHVPSINRQHHQKLPIVYHDQYNFLFRGYNVLGFWQSYMAFDLTKYKKIIEYLKQKFSLKNCDIYTPGEISGEGPMISQADLSLIHSHEYLERLKNNTHEIAEIVYNPLLKYLPAFLVHSFILDRMRLATQGTCDAVNLAIRYGWAINLGGGYHHAKASSGSGHCIYNDVAIAIKKIWQTSPRSKVLIVDLDAHHGNGNAAIFQDELKAGRVAIFDMYDSPNFPGIDRDTYDFQYDIDNQIIHCDMLPSIPNHTVIESFEFLEKSLKKAVQETLQLKDTFIGNAPYIMSPDIAPQNHIKNLADRYHSLSESLIQLVNELADSARLSNSFPHYYKVTKSIPLVHIPGYPMYPGDHYLEKLAANLPGLIDEYKPNLIIYNAGSDVHIQDCHHLGLTTEDVATRDAYVFQQAMQRNIPIAMVLSGGYGPNSHAVVSNSIENLLKILTRRNQDISIKY